MQCAHDSQVLKGPAHHGPRGGQGSGKRVIEEVSVGKKHFGSPLRAIAMYTQATCKCKESKQSAHNSQGGEYLQGGPRRGEGPLQMVPAEVPVGEKITGKKSHAVMNVERY